MNIRQLRCFLALAEDLHFTRAAEQLGIAQPTLSEQIRKLETEVGAALLVRSSRHVALTPAGRVLREHAQRALDDLDHALRVTRLAAAGHVGEVRLGAVGSAMTRFVPALLRALHEHTPDLTVRVQQLSTTAQLTALIEHRLDAGLLRAPVLHPAVRTEAVLHEPLNAVLPTGHPLTARSELTLADLASETLILWPRAQSPGAYDDVLGHFLRAGLHPSAIIEAPDTTSEVALLAAGLGVALQPASFNVLAGPDISLVPLRKPAPRSTLALAWLPPVENAALQHLLSNARAMAVPR